ncbi:trifunctional serine/threonine-protein kinase/ATP-binding protein/sensor histidine kinase [Sphingomonas sp.]|uniref:trifunctional serine/threonine-protein kinase/ATP-binding protein/sensor histidine kinase n=1 Tax=Sphingomonas sp. TaxID=28214 RepID=UPI003B3A47EA
MKPSFQIHGEDHVRFLCGEMDLVSPQTGSAKTDVSHILLIIPVGEQGPIGIFDRFAHELSLKNELDPSWALIPLELRRMGDVTALALADQGGDFLANILNGPMETGRFLQLAISIVKAVHCMHRRGLVHKDLKPSKIIVDLPDGGARLTGFGIASCVTRERQAPASPETIDGTLAYMAPEQTGRTNRSIDVRSDLYALGVTFYQMATGELPFAASDAMEWIHCHLARTPVAPDRRVKTVPALLSQIIMRLLAKAPEDRYQTAGGLERDLEFCLRAWAARGGIDAFDLGRQDAPDRPLIPERLYGRDSERAIIAARFNQVTEQGCPELLLVSGPSGAGKSALVHDLPENVLSSGTSFASGKFDQNQCDIPYGTLVESLHQLVHALLSQSDAGLAQWRQSFAVALGANARLMTDLIPELKLIIGDQPAVPDLPLAQAQVRFRSTFQRFIGVFARPERPLILFLDDLQWVDAATLDLLEDILLRPELSHLLLIGAYRDNEVEPGHPLSARIRAIQAAGGKTTEMTIAPLGLEPVEEMLADALRTSGGDVQSLARLVHRKTAGNPFFIIQFLSVLADNHLLVVDHQQARWSWDVDRIEAQHHTDNVIDLLVEKLVRLPKEVQVALRMMSCLGNSADLSTLAMILGIDGDQVETLLMPARQLELIERLSGTYRFSHDRIQEAAYSLIPEALRPAAHLQIGRLMMEQMSSAAREEAIFDIVNQFNRAAGLILPTEERETLAEINLMAGNRAKAAAAYASAATYFAAGAALLTDQTWSARPHLSFTLTFNAAECEFAAGDPDRAEQRLAALCPRMTSLAQSAAVSRLRGEIYVTLGRHDDALAVGLEYLRQIGTDWSAHPSNDEVQAEYRELRDRLAGLDVQSLADLRPASDPAVAATMEVLLQLAPAALARDVNLFCITVCRMANLSLEKGSSDEFQFACVWLGSVLGPYFGDYDLGFRIASLGLKLVEERGLDRFRARARLLLGAHINPWSRHVRKGREMVQRAFSEASDVGDVMFAGYCCCDLITILLGAGETLDAVKVNAEEGLQYARDHHYSFVIDLIEPQLQFVQGLRGVLPSFGRLDGEGFSEALFEQRMDAPPLVTCWYFIRKLQARYFAGSYHAALEAAEEALPILWTATPTLEIADYHFYTALTRAALHDEAPPGDRASHRDAIPDHHRRLAEWAENSPETFGNRAALVGAEMARIDGNALQAMHLYEQAIQAAEEHGFTHIQALANELASRFYAAEGFETIAATYRREARHSYLGWGAIAKVRQLDRGAAHSADLQVSSATSTVASPAESLDLTTVIKVSQAISGETALDRLVDTLMRTVMEHAGGEHAVLLLADGDGWREEAHALVEADDILVRSQEDGALNIPLPRSLLRYVARVKESVILEDALLPNALSGDPYFKGRYVRSLLCLPLINRSNVIGLLYIENNLAPGVFTSSRLAILKLIALQAAISLENARLYQDIAERESKIRRLVESDVIGIVIWDLDGRLVDANDAFLSMLQCDRADLKAGLRWFDMTPPEWQDKHIQEEAEELRTTGAMRAREKEYFRKDGSRVPVLIGAAVFESQPNQGVAYILDLTDLKRAEAEARENEQRYREAQTELAHANRISTLGQLTGSIAHEVNQPITATVTNAQAALRELRSAAPDMAEIEDALDSIAKDGIRAGEIIARIRGLVKKSPPSEVLLDLNDPIRGVIELTQAEAAKHAIRVVTHFAEGLPAIFADRVQIQQVMLNLIVNAVEAMTEAGMSGGDLVISTERAPMGGVLVKVADSGPGLTLDEPDRVFEAFYTSKTSGLGMGLSICRSIIEGHGGRISASANMPRGALFQFTIPAAVRHSLTPPTTA